MVREEIARYAVAMAGTPVDLDEELEAASLDEWEAPRRRTNRRERKR
jgi:hypothetical protein